MTEEIWKDVPSLPGVKVSSYGRVLLPVRTIRMPNGGTRNTKPEPRYGYPTKERRVVLRDRFFGTLKIHQIVCEAFNGRKPFPTAVVMHLDEDFTNNIPSNLAWGTQKENLNAPGFLAYCRNRTGDNHPRRRVS